MKAYEEKNGIRIYYKMSNYDSYRGIFGHECVNELIVSRLLDILEIPHLSYQLVFDTFYELYREKKESPLEFAKRYGWEQYIYQMFVVDYLICNRDRHGANVEVLIDEKEEPRLAPLFDHGLSLLFSCYDNLENVRKFDILEDRAVNNFIGSKSLEYNLQLLPKGQKFFAGELKEEHKEILMEGLEQVLSKEYLEKIWEMIWERWKRYVEVCN